MADKKSQFDKSAYDQTYIKENIRSVRINFNKIHDADIISHLDRKENKSGYIKGLIRKDMNQDDQEG